jgi:hypothetical protein
MEHTVAYLSRGRLYVKTPGRNIQEIESPFALSAIERQQKSQQMNGWKERSGVWGSMGMAPPEWSQWQDASEGTEQRPIQFKCIASGKEAKQIYYILDFGDVSGVFRYELDTKRESRLMHRNAFPAQSLACRADGELAISLQREDGSIGLAFSRSEGRQWSHVTGGDSIDQAPSWIPGKRCVVFQSAAVGRNEQGHRVGQAEYVIESIALDGNSEAQTICENQGSDLLMPRLTDDDQLYFIRRPYKSRGQEEVSPIVLLTDILLFPYRLIRALFYFLNFFSVMFTGKPLSTSAMQASRQQNSQRSLMLWGHMIDTQRAMKRNANKTNNGIVPKEWELVRRATDGNETVLAHNVLAYDLCDDSEIVLRMEQTFFCSMQTGPRQYFVKAA